MRQRHHSVNRTMCSARDAELWRQTMVLRPQGSASSAEHNSDAESSSSLPKGRAQNDPGQSSGHRPAPEHINARSHVPRRRPGSISASSSQGQENVERCTQVWRQTSHAVSRNLRRWAPTYAGALPTSPSKSNAQQPPDSRTASHSRYISRPASRWPHSGR